MEKTTKRLSLTTTLLLIGFIPLIVSGIAVILISSGLITGKMEESVYGKLYSAANGLRQYYGYDIAVGEEVEYEHDYVDSLKDKNIEMTLFLGDTRFITSALNDKGERNEGTQMDAGIWADVQNGKEVYKDGVNIGGSDYYVCYLPLYDGENKVVGSAWAGEPEASVTNTIKSMITSMVIVLVVSVIIFAIIIVLIARIIISSISKIVNSVDQLSEGAINNDIDTTSKIKEIYQISVKLESFKDKLGAIVGDVKNASTNVGTQAKELTTTSDQISDMTKNVAEAVSEIAKGANDQAETIQMATENIAILSDAIQTVSDNAEQLAGAAGEMGDASNQSASALDKLSQNMNAMGEAINAIAATMKETNNSVNSVNEKVDGITSIASQTNLLALNASIEAARAGEAGRGFAVVAEEIGKLATDSATTASEIRDEMAKLLVHANDAQSKTEEVTDLSKEVVSVLDETSGVVTGLIGNVSSTVDGVNNISGLTEECNASKEQIVDAMSSLSAISEENAASTTETETSVEGLDEAIGTLTDASKNLNAIVEGLNESLGFFKV